MNPSFATHGNAASIDNCIAPPSPTACVIADLANAQGQTHEMLETLRARLQLVLLPRGVDGGPEKPQPEPLRSPLCDELTSRLRVELGLHSRISEILNSLSI